MQNSANKVVIDPITAINVDLSMPETFNPLNGEKITAAINPVNPREIPACSLTDFSLCMKTRITYMGLTLPLSGRRGAWGGEAESSWGPVHSRGVFEVSLLRRQRPHTLASPTRWIFRDLAQLPKSG